LAAGEFQGGGDQDGFGGSDPGNGCEVVQGWIGAGFIDYLEDSIDQGHDVMGFGPAPQKDGQEFLVGKGLCAFLLELFPGAVKKMGMSDIFFTALLLRLPRLCPSEPYFQVITMRYG